MIGIYTFAGMSKLQKVFRLAAILVRRPRQIMRVLDENTQWKKYVLRKWKKEAFPVIEIRELFRGISKEPIRVHPYTFLEGGSMLTDLAVLRLFARRIPECRYFEIGTWRGESAANVAEEGAECHTLNISKEEMLRHGYDDAAASQVGVLISKQLNITLHRANSASFDFASLGGKFDLIFIDGDHHYEAVARDTKNIIHHLCHPGSIVCWHDYAYHPEAIRHEVMAGILEGVPESLHAQLYHISNTKLAVMLPEEMDGKEFSSPAQVESIFSVEINLD